MAIQDSDKEVLRQTGITGTVGSSELQEDDLQAVTGGLSGGGGSTMGSADTDVCVSTD